MAEVEVGNLTLSRRRGQSILIGDPDDPRVIRIYVNDVWSGKVRLCIEAPKDIPITREELLGPRDLGGES